MIDAHGATLGRRYRKLGFRRCHLIPCRCYDSIKRRARAKILPSTVAGRLLRAAICFGDRAARPSSNAASAGESQLPNLQRQHQKACTSQNFGLFLRIHVRFLMLTFKPPRWRRLPGYTGSFRGKCYPHCPFGSRTADATARRTNAAVEIISFCAAHSTCFAKSLGSRVATSLLIAAGGFSFASTAIKPSDLSL